MFPSQEVNDASSDASMSGIPCLLADAMSRVTTGDARQQTLCNACVSSRANPDRPSIKLSLTGCPQSLRDAEGHSLSLAYDDDAETEEAVVKEIVAMGSEGPTLTVAFLMAVCVQSSAAQRNAAELRRLLLLIAANAQSAIWVSRLRWLRNIVWTNLSFRVYECHRKGLVGYH